MVRYRCGLLSVYALRLMLDSRMVTATMLAATPFRSCCWSHDAGLLQACRYSAPRLSLVDFLLTASLCSAVALGGVARARASPGAWAVGARAVGARRRELARAVGPSGIASGRRAGVRARAFSGVAGACF